MFELVVHTLDLATAIGAPMELPTEAARVSFQLAGDLALRTGKGATVLRALTGRDPLPVGFSILRAPEPTVPKLVNVPAC